MTTPTPEAIEAAARVVYECPSGNTLIAEWQPERGEISLTVTPGVDDRKEGMQDIALDIAPEHINFLIAQLRVMQKSLKQ